jgi:hypothetical protein
VSNQPAARSQPCPRRRSNFDNSHLTAIAPRIGVPISHPGWGADQPSGLGSATRITP